MYYTSFADLPSVTPYKRSAMWGTRRVRRRRVSRREATFASGPLKSIYCKNKENFKKYYFLLEIILFLPPEKCVFK